MLTVFLISTLSYHIHNPFMLLGSDEECRSSFAGVIYEDLDGDGALGLKDEVLPGLVNLRSQVGTLIRKYKTDDGSFITTEMPCGMYDVLYQYSASEPEEFVGEIEVDIVMGGERYPFIGTRPLSDIEAAEEEYTLYLPYIAR